MFTTVQQPGHASIVDAGGGNKAMLTKETASGVVGDVVADVRNDYSSVNVTTGADVTLIASVVTAVSAVEIFDSSGETMELKVNGTRKMYITPGGNDDVKSFKAEVGDSIEVRAVSNNATVGELTINFFG